MIGKRIAVVALAVLIPYVASFGILWTRTHSPSPPKPTLSAKDRDVLELIEEILTRHIDSADKQAKRSSAQAERLRTTVKRISQESALYGNAADEMLSDAQLALNDQRNLEDVEKMLVGQLKLCDLLVRGLRDGIRRRDLMETIGKIQLWGPKIDELIEDTDRGITKTRLGLRIDPKTLSAPAAFEWNTLMLSNMEQQSTLSDQKKLNSDVGKAAESLKKLVEHAPVTYQTLRFPF